MNIYYTSQFPRLCAQSLDDKTLGTSLVYCCALLDLAGEGAWQDWVCSSQANYVWMVNLFGEMNNEHCYRFGEESHLADHIFKFASNVDSLSFPATSFTPPPNCTPYSGMRDTKAAYKRHLQEFVWLNRKVCFTKRVPPTWIKAKLEVEHVTR